MAGLDKNTTKEDYHIGGDQSLVYESDVKVGELASVALVVGAWCTIFLLGGAEESVLHGGTTMPFLVMHEGQYNFIIILAIFIQST